MQPRPTLNTLDGLQITWKDGLPDDPSERSVIETTLITSGLTSKYSAIKRLLDGDDDAAQEEMKRIEEEQAKAALAEVAAGVPGSAPPADQLSASDQHLAQMRADRGQADNSGAANQQRNS